MTTPLLILVLAASPSLLDSLHASFDTDLAKAKEKFPCASEWTEDAKMASCKKPEVQLMLDGGKVFSIGSPVVDHGTAAEADATFKRGIADLEKAKCKSLRKQGQMAIFECPQNFAVVLLYNWNSKDDTNSVSALYGTADKLLASVGLGKKK